MSHEDILKGLYEQTLVGNAPEVLALPTRVWPRAWGRRRCCSTR